MKIRSCRGSKVVFSASPQQIRSLNFMPFVSGAFSAEFA
jgi:hypothetical protein